MRRFQRNWLVATLSASVLVGAVALGRVLGPQEERCVVIHSDDAGMYASVNQATIDAMERGIVSSCSIMVPCPGFNEFARYAASHPAKDFGIHLDLNCEKDTDRWGPVLGKSRVPSLVDSQGFLWRDADDTARHAKMDEVEAELRAQIACCQRAGIHLSHLDHHMFVLFKRADFLRLYVRLGLDYDLPIRYSIAMPAPNDLDPSNPELVTAYRQGIEVLESRDMPLFKSIDTDNYEVPAPEKRKYFFDLFDKLPSGVSEILIHCAYGPSGPRHAPGVERREADTGVFMSQDTADSLRRRGIRVISWGAFRQMHAHKRRSKAL